MDTADKFYEEHRIAGEDKKTTMKNMNWFNIEYLELNDYFELIGKSMHEKKEIRWFSLMIK
jgi:hypothetical protein